MNVPLESHHPKTSDRSGPICSVGLVGYSSSLLSISLEDLIWKFPLKLGGFCIVFITFEQEGLIFSGSVQTRDLGYCGYI